MNALGLRARTRVDSPFGGITLAATDRGLAGLWFDGQKYHPGALDGVAIDPRQRFVAQAAEQLDAYWRDGTLCFAVPLDLAGTEFQRNVWRALTGIAPGTLRSYSEVAVGLGVPSAVRAVGAAIGRNPVSVIVPCHRVLGSDGTLTGYAGGLERKRALLALEVA